MPKRPFLPRAEARHQQKREAELRECEEQKRLIASRIRALADAKKPELERRYTTTIDALNVSQNQTEQRIAAIRALIGEWGRRQLSESVGVMA